MRHDLGTFASKRKPCVLMCTCCCVSVCAVGNVVGVEGRAAFARALRKNSVLKTLHYEGMCCGCCTPYSDFILVFVFICSAAFRISKSSVVGSAILESNFSVTELSTGSTFLCSRCLDTPQLFVN